MIGKFEVVLDKYLIGANDICKNRLDFAVKQNRMTCHVCGRFIIVHCSTLESGITLNKI